MKKSEATRQTIIEKSALTFNLKGYDSTSMSDIQQLTGLSRGALYGNFADKNELIVDAYEFNFNASLARTKASMSKFNSASDKLMAYVSQYNKDWKGVFERGGCPMLNAAVEADDHLVFMKPKVSSSIKQFIVLIRDTIVSGQADGEFNKDCNAQEYAELMFSMVEGSIMLAKSTDEPKHLRKIIERIKMIIAQELTA